jgi:hypothetical protein
LFAHLNQRKLEFNLIYLLCPNYKLKGIYVAAVQPTQRVYSAQTKREKAHVSQTSRMGLRKRHKSIIIRLQRRAEVKFVTYIFTNRRTSWSNVAYTRTIRRRGTPR